MGNRLAILIGLLAVGLGGYMVWRNLEDGVRANFVENPDEEVVETTEQAIIEDSEEEEKAILVEDRMMRTIRFRDPETFPYKEEIDDGLMRIDGSPAFWVKTRGVKKGKFEFQIRGEGEWMNQIILLKKIKASDEDRKPKYTLDIYLENLTHCNYEMTLKEEKYFVSGRIKHYTIKQMKEIMAKTPKEDNITVKYGVE